MAHPNDESVDAPIEIKTDKEKLEPQNIFISARLKDQIQLVTASVKGHRIVELDSERPGTQRKGNIHKGWISRIEPSVDAAFVTYLTKDSTNQQVKRLGFLPMKEIAPEFYSNPPEPGARPNISEVMREGQEVLVQIDKEERGTKGAALTTYITLAGCYLVLLPNNPNSGGISRRIEGEDRGELKDVISDLPVPEGMSVIVRTAGTGKETEELQWDLSVLLKQWEAIQNSYKIHAAPCLLFKESDIIVRAVRDYLRANIQQIIIDDLETFERASRYIELVRPEFKEKLVHYEDKTPLFQKYQIDAQLDTMFQRELRLPSGGTIVIDRTEAMVTVDVNSASATGGQDIEHTAFQTNKEAAMEVARQLRLRDIGGIIVIDFIDMNDRKHQRDVEYCLQHALRADRARIQLGRISPRFGTLELSRQRLRPALSEHALTPCPHCHGQGIMRSTESIGLVVLRQILHDATRPHVGLIQVQAPVAVATYLMNEKRQSLFDIEQKFHISVVIIPNPHLEIPDYKVQYFKKDDQGGLPARAHSYEMVAKPDTQAGLHLSTTSTPVVEQAAVQSFVEAHPKSAPTRQTEQGILKRLFKRWFSADNDEAQPSQTPKTKTSSSHASASSGQQRHHHHRNGGNHRRRHPSAQGNHDNRSKPAGSTAAANPNASTPASAQATTTPSNPNHNGQRRRRGPHGTNFGNGNGHHRRRRPQQSSGNEGPKSSDNGPDTSSS